MRPSAATLLSMWYIMIIQSRSNSGLLYQPEQWLVQKHSLTSKTQSLTSQIKAMWNYATPGWYQTTTLNTTNCISSLKQDICRGGEHNTLWWKLTVDNRSIGQPHESWVATRFSNTIQRCQKMHLGLYRCTARVYIHYPDIDSRTYIVIVDMFETILNGEATILRAHLF